MESIWVLGGGVVSPDEDVVDIIDSAAGLVSELALGSALVKSDHCGEVLLGDRGGVGRANKSVSVGGVSDNAHLNSLLGNLIDDGTLSLENFSVGLEEISALHSWASGSSTNKNADIGILESN